MKPVNKLGLQISHAHDGHPGQAGGFCKDVSACVRPLRKLCPKEVSFVHMVPMVSRVLPSSVPGHRGSSCCPASSASGAWGTTWNSSWNLSWVATWVAQLVAPCPRGFLGDSAGLTGRKRRHSDTPRTAALTCLEAGEAAGDTKRTARRKTEDGSEQAGAFFARELSSSNHVQPHVVV